MVTLSAAPHISNSHGQNAPFSHTLVLDEANGTMPTRIMATIRSVCVYCGSGEGQDPAYAHAARVVGRALAGAGLRLVYGGGNLGLMGIVARTVIDEGGTVTGIIPQFLSERERMLQDVHELIVTDNMHQRKMMMFDRADAFVALPGGVGTLEELVEMMTWYQLGQHAKPIVLANINGFWAPLLSLLEHMRAESFIREGFDVSYQVADTAEDVVPMITGARRMTAAGPA
jgi:hypothetical protein